MRKLSARRSRLARPGASQLSHRSLMTPQAPALSRHTLTASALAALALAWAYLPLGQTWLGRWLTDPDWSHGFLVPVFAALLLAVRRDTLPCPLPDRFSWWGVPFFVVAALLRLGGSFWHLEYLQSLSFLLCLAGAVVLVGGWGLLRWSWPALAFLVFMMPLPHQVETALAGPLQRLTAELATVSLRLGGLPAVTRGTSILLEQHRVDVVKACSGLGTLAVFFALATGLVLLTRPPWPERLVLLVSAVPIALVANVARVAGTALLQQLAAGEYLRGLFHDLAGWLMMLLALGLLWLELFLLRCLFVEVPAAGPAGEGGPGEPGAVPALRAVTDTGRGPPQGGGPGVLGSLPLLPVLALILLQGALHGWWSDRWGEPADLRDAVRRLHEVPHTLAGWQGQDLEVDTSQHALAGIQGALLRRYTRDGVSLTFFLVVGRSGPLAVHTPDVCFQGAGYALLDGPSRIPVGAGSAWKADFQLRDAPVPRWLRITWTWSHGGGWQAPDYPRLAFGHTRVLYKLYVLRDLPEGATPGGDDPTRDFLEQALPVLHEALFPSPTPES